MELKKIVFATNNLHKLQEVRHHLRGIYQVVSLQDIGFLDEIPEPYETLEENALAKSLRIYQDFGIDCFADDTGLEVDALGGAPGVYSARYAGPNCSFDDNVNKMLKEMRCKTNRSARFRTVVSLILGGQKYFFEGEVEGEILTERDGIDGFGYDPIFQPKQSLKSFAQMTLDEKNKISHRGRAMAKLVAFLS